MTAVFVHGNPETSFVWSDLVPELEQRGVEDIVLLSPPGFGGAVPDGFDGSRLAHRDWLIGQLEDLGDPVDLVGHDWGAGHVYAVAAERPDLLRSWAADCAGLVHPDYEWHPAAAVWQTEGDGEESVKGIVALDGDELGAAFGVPPRLAPTMAEHLDDTMGDAILKVYRSAAQPAMRQLGDQLAQADRRPALLIHPTADPFVPPEMTPPVAARMDAEILALDGLGHWWMFEDPAQAAAGLVDFWARA
ncbi:alpha/beta fold hydrolase [Aeromicrobium wangtongii]|uniref:Alpha/beta hydrolase n=1 Tax=Aeromicrobium wangtongii TaxID=2969247 RepID=A0ABY5MBK3_9ACTN|nr:alpha/beta hydrolase [Aeromicrobium wangtongii]MCD9197718.1 alpha/beta hydrolase [Aeromicrobium wangtongii]UUP15202.1 alpha/beta hydrolase [Aeromicrobium wangtongii]